MTTGKLEIPGVHSGRFGRFVHLLLTGLELIVICSDDEHSARVRELPSRQQVHRIHLHERRFVAAEYLVDGSLSVTERRLQLTGQIEECRVHLGVIGRHLQ